MKMKMLDGASTIEDLTGLYGPGPFTAGIISDHLHLAEKNPALRVHVTANRMWVVPVAGGKAVPVLCSEVIEVRDEDGVHSGRCGAPAHPTTGVCAD